MTDTKKKWRKPPTYTSDLKYNIAAQVKTRTLIDSLRMYYGLSITFLENHRLGASEKAFMELEEDTIELLENGTLPRNMLPTSLRYAIAKLRTQYTIYERGQPHPLIKFKKCKKWSHISFPASSCIFNPETREIWIVGIGKIETTTKLIVPVNASKVTLHLEEDEMRVSIAGFQN